MIKKWIAAGSLGLGMLLSVNCSAGVVEKAFNGMEFGVSPALAIELIKGHCDSIETIDIEPPMIPIARESETHLLCRNYKTEEGPGINEVVFVFADGSLDLIEAHGGVVASLSFFAGAEPIEFLDYVIYLEDKLVTIPAAEAAWLLTPESLHPHMFLWHNPVLTANTAREFKAPAAIPSVLQFGSSIDEVGPLLESSCDMTSRQEIEEVWLPTKPSRQTQINCYGYDYAGFLRKIEAVFGDDILQVAWILTGAGEEDRLRQLLVKEFGAARSDNGVYEVFNNGRVALRKDKPEVLMLAEDLVPYYQKEFGEAESGLK